MDQAQRGPADIEVTKRLAVLANATADAKAMMERGEHETDKAAQTTVSPEEVDAIIGTWPAAATMGVQPTGGSGDPDQPVPPGPKAKAITEQVEAFLSTSGRT